MEKSVFTLIYFNRDYASIDDMRRTPSALRPQSLFANVRVFSYKLYLYTVLQNRSQCDTWPKLIK